MLDELYRELVLEHGKKPRHREVMTDPDRQAEGFNPLCGDKVTVYLKFDDEQHVASVTFMGQSCAICTASASIMTLDLRGKSLDEVRARSEEFRTMLTAEEEPGDLSSLGELGMLNGVRRFPMRVKCATLPWHTMLAALDDSATVAKTE